MGCASDGRPLHTSYHSETRQSGSPRSQPVAVEGPVCRRSLISIEHSSGLWVVSLVLMIMAVAPPHFPCPKKSRQEGLRWCYALLILLLKPLLASRSRVPRRYASIHVHTEAVIAASFSGGVIEHPPASASHYCEAAAFMA
jgi:hypothetical protein